MRKPADAEAYKTRTIAEAQRDARISQAEAQAREVELAGRGRREAREARGRGERRRGRARSARRRRAATKARGLAEGEAVKAKGLAEAEAIKARAEALAQNQEAVIGQQIAEQLPQIVGEAAKAFGNIGQLTVLNGAEGIGQMFIAGARDGRGRDPDAAQHDRRDVEERLNGSAAAKPSVPEKS